MELQPCCQLRRHHARDHTALFTAIAARKATEAQEVLRGHLSRSLSLTGEMRLQHHIPWHVWRPESQACAHEPEGASRCRRRTPLKRRPEVVSRCGQRHPREGEMWLLLENASATAHRQMKLPRAGWIA